MPGDRKKNASIGFLALVLGSGLGAGCSLAPEFSVPGVGAAELLERIEGGSPPPVLDVRSETEFAAAHIPGAMNIPHDQLAGRIQELDWLRETELVLYCRSGQRTKYAEEVLMQAGFRKLRHLEGDLLLWVENEYPLEEGENPEGG